MAAAVKSFGARLYGYTPQKPQRTRRKNPVTVKWQCPLCGQNHSRAEHPAVRQ